ncbi:acyl-CoA dehydrogenase [Mycolicibacterium litorale]|uniref:Acyl-CoA dehydrogenase n=1 Tax=Mycolicibacterium litorale TaxID=758802 RepID=A0A6S6PBX1_9MYCO|nr:acyl-CoA dehydrogenase [Mycolicibacterium litorale]
MGHSGSNGNTFQSRRRRAYRDWVSTAADADRVAQLANRVVADHDPKTVPIPEFLGACYDAGLSWVHFPEGLGGLGVSRGLQAVADGILQGAGGPVPLGLNPMGYGMAAPTIREHAQTEEVKRSWLRPLATTEHIWCQLFSEPGAGSDLAGLATSAVPDGDDWVINGQKVWTSLAHRARWGLLLARTDPDVPKHKGLTYFVVDMHSPGVQTRPLRQLTGHAEFNEVYFTDARIPDAHRLGAVGDGWRVAMTTLMNERSALGASGSRRGAGTIADAVALWASRPHRQTPVLRDRLTELWLRAEAQRLTSERSRASATVGGPGPEGSIGKLVGAELNQRIYQWCMDFLGPEGLLYHSYAMDSGDKSDWRGPVQQRFLRSRANTIEGGTSDVMRNILGERVLGLPGDLRADAGMPWKEVPRG